MKREEGETYLTDHSPEFKKQKLDSCESGRFSETRFSGGQPTLVNVKTADKLLEQLEKTEERLEKVEEKKRKWKERYRECQKREKSDLSESERQAPLTEDINRLKEENAGLKATVEELKEKNQKLTRQVLDLQRRFPAAAPPNSETKTQ